MNCIDIISCLFFVNQISVNWAIDCVFAVDCPNTKEKQFKCELNTCIVENYVCDHKSPECNSIDYFFDGIPLSGGCCFYGIELDDFRYPRQHPNIDPGIVCEQNELIIYSNISGGYYCMNQINNLKIRCVDDIYCAMKCHEYYSLYNIGTMGVCHNYKCFCKRHHNIDHLLNNKKRFSQNDCEYMAAIRGIASAFYNDITNQCQFSKETIKDKKNQQCTNENCYDVRLAKFFPKIMKYMCSMTTNECARIY